MSIFSECVISDLSISFKPTWEQSSSGLLSEEDISQLRTIIYAGSYDSLVITGRRHINDEICFDVAFAIVSR